MFTIDEWRVEKFWQKVEKDGPIVSHMTTACWLWTGAQRPTGYGNFNAGRGRTVSAHKLSFFLATGEYPPPELQILHLCDNRPCVRPDHLTKGKAANNSQDMVLRGRSRYESRNPSAKLSLSAVRAIRQDYAVGTTTQAYLAKKWDVCLGTIRLILKGKTWTRDKSVILTQKERMSAVGIRNGHATQPERTARGERNGRAKLTRAQVEFIRAGYSLGRISARQLAEQFGVCRYVIRRICKGDLWKTRLVVPKTPGV